MARIALIKLFTGLTLGVSQLSAELRKRGHETTIVYFKDWFLARSDQPEELSQADYSLKVANTTVNLNFQGYKPATDREYELLVQALEQFKPDAIGLSLTSSAMTLAAEVTGRLRERLNVPIIWGGVGPTMEPERSLEAADYVCVFEGEEVIVEIAERLDRSESLQGIAGLWHKSDGKPVPAPQRPVVDLDNIAIPDIEPGRWARIENNAIRRGKRPPTMLDHYVIMTSRGCPFSCSFCVESAYQDLFGKKGSLRRRSVDLVIEELVQAKEKFGFTSVYFYDDVFTTHRKWLAEFAVKYKREVNLPFWCYTYPTTTRRADVELLRDAGCTAMGMGVQAASPDILAHFNRPAAQADRVVEAAETICGAGIRLFIDLLTKIEFETEEDLRANVDLLLRLPKDTIYTHCYEIVSFPGYGYTEHVRDTGAQHQLSAETYRYYHHLYDVARADLPLMTRKALIANPLFRRHPEMLKRFARKKMWLSYIEKDDLKKVQGQTVLDASGAQALVPESLAQELGMGAAVPPPATPEPAPLGARRLPVVG